MRYDPLLESASFGKADVIVQLQRRDKLLAADYKLQIGQRINTAFLDAVKKARNSGEVCVMAYFAAQEQ